MYTPCIYSIPLPIATIREKKLYKLHFLIFIFSVLSTIDRYNKTFMKQQNKHLIFSTRINPLHLSQN